MKAVLDRWKVGFLRDAVASGPEAWVAGSSWASRLLPVGSALVLFLVAARAGGESPPEKRVENRGTPAETSARPSGVTPGKSGEPSSSSGGKPEKCETQHPTPQEPSTIEETKTVEKQETVVVEVQPVVIEAPRYAAIPEVLQDTLGLPKAESVSACLDPRYPFPSYAFVGLVPALAANSTREVVRLQRLEIEMEVGADWRANHSVFTLVVGAAQFELALSQELSTETLLVRDAVGGRRYPVEVGVSRPVGVTRNGRCRLAIDFTAAVRGEAPALRPGEGIYLAADLAPSAPPGSAAPKFVLVRGNRTATTALSLVEKSGTPTSVIPALNELDLAAYCSLVRLGPL